MPLASCWACVDWWRSKRFREEARLREPAGAGPGVRKMLPNSLSPMGPSTVAHLLLQLRATLRSRMVSLEAGSRFEGVPESRPWEIRVDWRS